MQRQLTRSILTSDELSNATRNVLFQHDLVERWQNDPAGTIAVLQKAVASGGARRADLFALAELSFAYAEKANDPAYHRAAAVYAWIFLFPSDEQQPLGRLDTRARIAADLYNRGLALGFASGPKSEFVPHQGRYPMPFGYLDVSFDAKELVWGRRRLDRVRSGRRARRRGPRDALPLVGYRRAARREHGAGRSRTWATTTTSSRGARCR